MIIKEHIPLAPYTTFRLGGPARFFVRVRQVDELKEALVFAKDKNLNVFVLGGGSNVLVSDAGFDGLVIKVELPGIDRQGDMLVAAAGERWDGLVARAVGAGLWGLENLSGVPGTVGGAVVQNIGAYGAALSQTLESVEVYDCIEGDTKTLERDALEFGYRSSLFKKNEGRYVVLRATFKLSVLPSPNVSYKDLAQRFEGRNPSLADIREAVLAIRAQKFPDLSKEGTAGSFFLNPVVPEGEARRLQERFPGMPLFAMPETSDMKVPLGWILDHMLNLRGFAQGPVRLFERQALVVVASQGAHASDVRALAEKIKNEVKEKINLEIIEEVRVL